MMKIAESQFISENDQLDPPRTPDRRPTSEQVDDALDRVAGRIDGPGISLTLAPLRDSVVVDRSGQGATLWRGQVGNATPQFVQIVVLANSAEEREQFIDQLATRLAAELVPGPGSGVLEIHELRIDTDSHRVTVSGREIFLTTVEYKLLITLAEHRERVLQRRVLLRDVWSLDEDATARRVDIAVRRLRVKLGSAARFLQTLRGFGYRFSENPPA
jgi:hypothetical protein